MAHHHIFLTLFSHRRLWCYHTVTRGCLIVVVCGVQQSAGKVSIFLPRPAVAPGIISDNYRTVYTVCIAYHLFSFSSLYDLHYYLLNNTISKAQTVFPVSINSSTVLQNYVLMRLRL
jgi:hypothetical protein